MPGYLNRAARHEYGKPLVSTLLRSRQSAEKERLLFESRNGRREVRMRHEMFERELDGSAQQADGMQTFRDFLAGIDIINEHSFAMSPQQSEILMMCLQAVLQQVFTQGELIKHLSFLLDFFGMDELFEDVIIQMRRRGGKTIVISCFIALFIVCMPEGNTNVFSSSARVSTAMKDVVRGVVHKLVAHGERFRGCRIETDNKETLALRSVHGTLNIVNFFPSNEKIGARVPCPLSSRQWIAVRSPPSFLTLLFLFISPHHTHTHSLFWLCYWLDDLDVASGFGFLETLAILLRRSARFKSVHLFLFDD